MPRSINQNAYAGGLPNFRNLGILLRIGVIANAFAFAAAVIKSHDLQSLWQQVIRISALVEPMLILSLVVLAAVSNWLRRAPYWLGAAAVFGLEVGLTAALHPYATRLLGPESAPLGRY